MRFSKRTLATALAVVPLAAAAIAPAADAASISQGYCAASLQGITGQAGDNDIRKYWDLLQSLGLNVTSTSANPYAWGFFDNLTYNYDWRFYTSNGGTRHTGFRCYWSGGTYHDESYY